VQHVSKITFQPDPGGVFSIQHNAPLDLQPHALLTIQITAKAAPAGRYKGVITIFNDGPTPQVTICCFINISANGTTTCPVGGSGRGGVGRGSRG
jgi:hypothetical protein